MEYFLVWIALSAGVGLFGIDKTIGFWGAFLLSLILSPLIGAIIVFFSKSKEQKAIEQQMMMNQQQQTKILHDITNKNNFVADELLKLKKLLDEKVITDEEYQKMKRKLIP